MERKKNIEMKMKEKIDIESLVYRSSTISSLVICVIIIINNVFLQWRWLSGFCIGFDTCLIMLMFVVGIAGHKNYKYDMERFEWLMTQYDMNGDDNDAKSEKDEDTECGK